MLTAALEGVAEEVCLKLVVGDGRRQEGEAGRPDDEVLTVEPGRPDEGVLGSAG